MTDRRVELHAGDILLLIAARPGLCDHFVDDDDE